MNKGLVERRQEIAGAVHSWCEAGYSGGAGQGGLPLVMLHGIGSNARSWSDQLAALAPQRRVLAWDMPGYGAAEVLAQPHPTPDDYAAALAAFLTALGITRCDLVGHSLGALLAGRFARRSPAAVRKLVLSSPAAGYAVPPGVPLPDKLQARIDDVIGLGPVGLADKRAAGTLAPDAPPEVLEAVRRAMAAVTLTGYSAAVWMLAQGDLAADIPLLASPTLVMVGSLDRVTPPEGVERLAALLPDPRIAVIEGAGHASYADHCMEYSALLREFLAA